MREIIIVFGNDDKTNFIENIIRSKGESTFCRNIRDLKPFHKWLLIKTSEKKFYSYSQNLLIDCKRLLEVPLELRVKAIFFKLEKPFPLLDILDKRKKFSVLCNILAGNFLDN